MPQETPNFTKGQRWGTFLLNGLIPGLGSYVVMQDWVGGSIMLGAGVPGWIFYIIGFTDIMNTEPPYTLDYYSGEYDYDYDDDDYNAAILSAVIKISVGGVLLLTTGILNIVRSVNYDKPRPKAGSIVDITAWNFGVQPGKNGIDKVSLFYTLRY